MLALALLAALYRRRLALRRKAAAGPNKVHFPLPPRSILHCTAGDACEHDPCIMRRSAVRCQGWDLPCKNGRYRACAVL